jgi:hypothetical protein
MKDFLKIFLLFLIILTFGACSGDKQDQNEPKSENDSETKSDHLYRSQFDALDKAKNVEKKLLDSHNSRLEGLEDKVEDSNN